MHKFLEHPLFRETYYDEVRDQRTHRKYRVLSSVKALDAKLHDIYLLESIDLDGRKTLGYVTYADLREHFEKLPST